MLLVLLCLSPWPAAAQDQRSSSLAGLLPELILREITLPRPTTPELSHGAHFSPIDANELSNPAVDIVERFNKLMRVQLSTFPLGSSAGGFTYVFDESLGTLRRASRSFGPAFAERAMTIGRGRLSAGATYQHTRYDSFEGETLDDGSIKFYLRHQECCAPGSGGGSGGGGGGGGGSSGPVEQPNGTRLSPEFEGDLIEAALSLKASTDTVAFFGNYGLTNRWDVGLVVPLVRVDLEASVQATILRLSTESSPLTHTFEAGNSQATRRSFQRSGTATGLGDLLVRNKYRFVDLPGGGLAAAVDVRLPSGDQDNLLGAGGQVKVYAIASGGTDRLVEHANVGYTVVTGEADFLTGLSTAGASTSLPDEVNYAAGVEFIAHHRLTILGDVVGRTLRGAGRLDVRTKSFDFQRANAVQTARFDEFEPRAGNLSLLLATGGIKFNPYGNLLVSASILFPLSHAGLASTFTTVLGVDFAF